MLWLSHGAGLVGGELVLGQTNGQQDIRLESSRPAGSILRKWVKPWVPLAVFTKLQTEMLRQEEGLQA